MFYRFKILAVLVLFFSAAPIQAADPGNGKSLQQKNCMSCHDDGIYTRENRRVTTLGGLKKQVKRCELSLGLKWFDDDVTDVTDYLNTAFYQFK